MKKTSINLGGGFMELNPNELRKPITKIGQKYVTLKDLKGPQVMTLAAPKEEDLKDIVLERYKMESPDTKIHILGRGSFTIKQLIEEIRNDTDLGKQLISNEVEWMNFLISKKKKGEIK